MYLELKSDQAYSNTAIVPDNILGIKYYSYDRTHEAVIKFFNEKGDLVKEVKRTIEYGNNFLVFKLDQSYSADRTYFIELNDLQLAKYRTAFRMSK